MFGLSAPRSASGQVLFHVQPPSMGARLAAERSPQPLSARLKTGATVQFSMAVAAQLGVSLNGAVDGHDRHRQERCAISSPRRLGTRAPQRDPDYARGI